MIREMREDISLFLCEERLWKKQKISLNLRENEEYIRKRCAGLRGYPDPPHAAGRTGRRWDCLMVYIEVAVSNIMLDDLRPGKDDQPFLGDTAGSDPGIHKEQQALGSRT